MNIYKQEIHKCSFQLPVLPDKRTVLIFINILSESD